MRTAVMFLGLSPENARCGRQRRTSSIAGTVFVMMGISGGTTDSLKIKSKEMGGKIQFLGERSGKKIRGSIVLLGNLRIKESTSRKHSGSWENMKCRPEGIRDHEKT
jgi:hypothetical protein